MKGYSGGCYLDATRRHENINQVLNVKKAQSISWISSEFRSAVKTLAIALPAKSPSVLRNENKLRFSVKFMTTLRIECRVL